MRLEQVELAAPRSALEDLRRFYGQELGLAARLQAGPSLVVELKAFTMGPTARMVGVRVMGWGATAARMAELEASFTLAVERLATRLSS